MEIWKGINDYPNYFISNLGNVKSFFREKERILKPAVDGTGYFTLCMSNDKSKGTKKIHQLVAIAFLRHIPCGKKLVVNHKNFIKTDNRLENLEIITTRENTNKKHIKSISKYVGIHWHKKNKKWIARIVVDRKRKYLGSFKKEYDAHLAYQKELLIINNKL